MEDSPIRPVRSSDLGIKIDDHPRAGRVTRPPSRVSKKRPARQPIGTVDRWRNATMPPCRLAVVFPLGAGEGRQPRPDASGRTGLPAIGLARQDGARQFPEDRLGHGLFGGDDPQVKGLGPAFARGGSEAEGAQGAAEHL